jgi:ribosomal protein S18 acetylase RimI-like enzyme
MKIVPIEFMITIKSAETIAELEGILDLQLENHLQTVSDQEKSEQGFVTVRHSLDQLQKMNFIASHIIAKEEDKVVGYILAMTKASKDLVPVLIPMFRQFDQLIYENQRVSEYDYLVIGQICVSKSHRGKGLVDLMYKAYKKAFSERYDFAITEIAKSNYRSLSAHKRIGFDIIHEFEDETQEWSIVAWNWK